MQEFENSLEKKFKFDYSAPCQLNIDLNKLKDFLLKDSKAVLIFYGGEPLLQSKKIKEIIDFLKDTHVKFRMQTNAKLLKNLNIEYLKKIDKILISIDGDKERTDKNRGQGTYDLVLENLKWLKSNGYNGELIARMTIAQDCPDLYEQVFHLINLNLFDSIHWQLDVGFYETDFNKNKLSLFFEKYNDSVEKLINWWFNEMSSGKVYRIYPFIAIIDSLLKKENTKIRCGAGHSGYAITTNGKIVACPIMNNIEDFNSGDLNSGIEELKKFEVDECNGCDVKDLCGGRCLYWRKAKLWPFEGDEMICDSIKFYIKELQKILSKIKKIINQKVISEKDFEYEKYFGPEIIP